MMVVVDVVVLGVEAEVMVRSLDSRRSLGMGGDDMVVVVRWELDHHGGGTWGEEGRREEKRRGKRRRGKGLGGMGDGLFGRIGPGKWGGARPVGLSRSSVVGPIFGVTWPAS